MAKIIRKVKWIENIISIDGNETHHLEQDDRCYCERCGYWISNEFYEECPNCHAIFNGVVHKVIKEY